MYRRIANAESVQLVIDALPKLIARLGLSQDSIRFWVCYGSFALGTQTSSSDIDLLMVHERSVPARRLQGYDQGRSVTIYSVPLTELCADGGARRYGGFFAGKLLNPHIILHGTDEDEHTAERVVSEFLGAFAAASAPKGRVRATGENLAADAILAYLRLCPAYLSYFIRYFTSALFEQIWECMVEAISSSFAKCGIVEPDGLGRFLYLSPVDENYLHIEMIRCVGRFWAFGALTHGNDHLFIDKYFRKCEEYETSHTFEGCRSRALAFLHERAGYP